MAINKNHEFEELDGVKCAIVEKNASKERVDFLKPLLEGNNYSVIVVPTPAPKVAAPPKPQPQPATTDIEASASAQATADKPAGTPQPQPDIPPPPPPIPEPPPPPTTFTIGVTDVSFNPTNAIFGRLLRTKEGNVVTLAYWQQKETVSHDEVPYFDKQTD